MRFSKKTGSANTLVKKNTITIYREPPESPASGRGKGILRVGKVEHPKLNYRHTTFIRRRGGIRTESRTHHQIVSDKKDQTRWLKPCGYGAPMPAIGDQAIEILFL